MRRLMVRVLVVVSLLLGTVACGDDDPTPIDPTPIRPTFTDTFEDSLTINGAKMHPFVAGGSGEIRATVTALGPNAEARIGVALGTLNATGACQLVITNDNATQGTILIGNAGGAGNYCLRVSDVGLLAAAATYTVTVVHF